MNLSEVTPAQTEEIIRLYTQEKLTIRKIAEHMNFKNWIVHTILVNNKIPWNRKYVKDFSQEEKDKIIEDFKRGITIQDIAKKLGISEPAISRLLEANNCNIMSTRKKYDYLREVPLTFLQEQFIVGNMLGDGCMVQNGGKGHYKLNISHCEEQKPYLQYCHKILEPISLKMSKAIDTRGNSIMWGFTTPIHPDMTKFGLAFYPGHRNLQGDRIKIVPDKIGDKDLGDYITPFSLAVLVMDDGTLRERVNFIFCTLGFTGEENTKLQKIFKKNFNLDCEVIFSKDKYYYLWLNKNNTQKLRNIVEPYIVPSMKYKLISDENYDPDIMTPEKVREIRQLKDNKVPNKVIMEKYKISRGTILNIWKRKSWSYIE